MGNDSLRYRINFSPDSFKELAKQLMQDPDYRVVDEARYRTVVSRFYYAVFLEIRERIRQFLQTLDAETFRLFMYFFKTGEIHAIIREILHLLDPFVGNIFSKLHLERRKADYELDEYVGFPNAYKASKLVQKLQQRTAEQTLRMLLNENLPKVNRALKARVKRRRCHGRY